MHILTSAAFALATVAQTVLAHGGVTTYIVDGVTYPGWQPYNSPNGQSSIGRPYSSYNPIYNPRDSTIHCNNNGQAGAQQKTAEVRAGATVVGRYPQWTHAQGPIMAYMANCNGDCTPVNSANLNWFKIHEAGLLSGTVGNGRWGTGQVMDTLEYAVTIPANLAPGNYLLRHELLALHQANTPQFYPECAQFKVTGSGTGVPSGNYLVRFPGAYSASDPGVTINIYDSNTSQQTSYQVPGPAVWTG